MNYKQIARENARARAVVTHAVPITYRCPRCDATHGVLLTWNRTPTWTCGSCGNAVDVTNLLTIRWPHS
jgi:hypothetical protein